MFSKTEMILSAFFLRVIDFDISRIYQSSSLCYTDVSDRHRKGLYPAPIDRCHYLLPREGLLAGAL